MGLPEDETNPLMNQIYVPMGLMPIDELGITDIEAANKMAEINKALY